LISAISLLPHSRDPALIFGLGQNGNT
jgi:hypothetical protein